MPANKTKAARPETANAKILLYDLECSPNIVYTWGVWEQNVIKIIEPRQIISFAWKWLGEKKVHVLALPDFPGYAKNRKNNYLLIAALHRLISKADIAVGHNIDGFDDKRANTDFIKHQFQPPPPHKTVDTLKIAKRYFQFNRNSLGELGVFLDLGEKVKHWGFELWQRCLDGDPKAWILMKKYNKGDVGLLERIYYKLRPWILNHPAVSKRGDVECPHCRSKNLQSRGVRITRQGEVPRYQCRNCGAWAAGMLVKDSSGKLKKKWIVR